VVDLRTGKQSQVQTVAYTGLPVVGVNFVRYVNGTLVSNGTQVLSNYGTSSTLKVVDPGVQVH